MPEDGVPAFAAWAAEAHDLTDADAILAGLAAAAMPDHGPVAVERHGTATTYALPTDRALSGVTETADAPALILRDLRGSRLSSVEMGGEATPALTLTPNGNGVTLTLECAPSQMDAAAPSSFFPTSRAGWSTRSATCSDPWRPTWTTPIST